MNRGSVSWIRTLRSKIFSEFSAVRKLAVLDSMAPRGRKPTMWLWKVFFIAKIIKIAGAAVEVFSLDFLVKINVPAQDG